MFFFTGLLFWARVIDPGPLRPRLVWPARIAYVVGAMIVGWVLAITLVLVPHPLYAHYAALAHRPGRDLGPHRPADRRRDDVGAGLDRLHDHDADRLLPLARARRVAEPARPALTNLRRTDDDMPSIPFADNFLAGSLLSLLLPIGLLIAIASGTCSPSAACPNASRVDRGAPLAAEDPATPPRDSLMEAGAGIGSEPRGQRRLSVRLADRRRAGGGGADSGSASASGCTSWCCAATSRAPRITTAAPGVARPGHLGGRRAAGAADHDAARPDRAAVLARPRCAAGPSLVSFFDSYCTQACPLEGRALAAAERSLPRGAAPGAVVVSVNPRDTPASTRAAVRQWGLSHLGAWHWLRGTHAQLAAVWNAYHIFVAPPAAATSPTPRRCICSTAAATSARRTCIRSQPGFVGADLQAARDEREVGHDRDRAGAVRRPAPAGRCRCARVPAALARLR